MSFGTALWQSTVAFWHAVSLNGPSEDQRAASIEALTGAVTSDDEPLWLIGEIDEPDEEQPIGYLPEAAWPTPTMNG